MTPARLGPILLLATACSGAAPDSGGGVPPVIADGGSGDGGDSGDARSAWLDDDVGSIVHVTWDQLLPADTWVEFRVEGEDWRSTPTRHLDAGPAEELLLGAPYGVSLTWRVASDAGSGVVLGPQQAIDTAPVPETLPLAELLVADDGRGDPSLQYLFLGIKAEADQDFDSWVTIVDRQGRPVWALEDPPGGVSVHPRISYDGTTMLVDHNSHWGTYDLGEGSEVVRMRIDGTVLDVIPMPGMRHAFTELPDHSLVYPRVGDGFEETLEQVDPDGTHHSLYSCLAWMEANGLVGSCGSNSLSWDPATDHFLYSLYTMETVIEVDRKTGDTLRYFGRALGAWNFAPVDAAFWWQHAAIFTEQGTLLLSSRRAEDVDETVVREYTLETTQQTLVELSSLGVDEGIYGDVMGEAWRLPNGNTLHNMGSASRIREYSPDGDVVWDLSWSASYVGRSTPIEDLYTLLR